MKFFTLEELTNSSTAKSRGISNLPNYEEKENLIALIENILDPLRESYGKPIIVTSGFRNEELNNIVGGAKKSLHRLGLAADIRSVSDTISENKKIFELAKKLPFDLLIDEHNYNWIHISFSPRNRRQILHIK